MMPRRTTIFDLLGLLTLAALCLWTCASIVGHSRMRCIVDNDAAGYTSVAATLAKTGHLQSRVIYPSFLSQHATKSVMYMPGFYATLAASYKLFGFGVLQSLAVSYLGYLFTVVCTYLIALRLFNRSIALAAAALVLLYPPNLYFANTAMMESTIGGVAALVLCAFVYLPRRAMLFVGPLLVAIPFLYRETSCFLVIPMALLLVQRCRADGLPTSAALKQAAVLISLTVFVTLAILVSPLSTGRPSPAKANIFLGNFDAVYRDALAAQNLHPSIGDWISKLAHRFHDNARDLLRWRLIHETKTIYIAPIIPTLLAIPVGLLWFWRKRDYLALGTAVLAAILFAFIFLTYTVREDKPVRLTMFAFPLVAILIAQLWDCFSGRAFARLPAGALPWPHVIAAFLVLCFTVRLERKALTAMMSEDTNEELTTSLIQWLGHDDHYVLAGPHWVCMPYVWHHDPVYYSFVPVNRETLDLLCARHPVGTIIFEPQTEPSTLTPQDMASHDLYPFRRVDYYGNHFTVYRRPETDAERQQWAQTFNQELKYPQ